MPESIESLSPWFYDFDLGSVGRTVSKLPPEIVGIHRTRLDMLNMALDQNFSAEELRGATCLDVGCHEGFYSIEVAKRGVREVLGIDIREKSLQKGRFAARALDLDNVSFRFLNVEAVSPKEVGRHELVLFLGLLYHVENPLLCVRNLYAVTEKVCVVETQVIDEIEGETEWGSGAHKKRPYHGVLALIDEAPDFQANPEAGISRIVTCPSRKAVTSMFLNAGFKEVEYIEPPPDAYEQLARGKRVVCVARV